MSTTTQPAPQETPTAAMGNIPSSTLQIEEGKFYRNGDGNKIGPMILDESDDGTGLRWKTEPHTRWYANDGKISIGKATSGRDLIEPWPEPATPASAANEARITLPPGYYMLTDEIVGPEDKAYDLTGPYQMWRLAADSLGRPANYDPNKKFCRRIPASTPSTGEVPSWSNVAVLQQELDQARADAAMLFSWIGHKLELSPEDDARMRTYKAPIVPAAPSNAVRDEVEQLRLQVTELKGQVARLECSVGIGVDSLKILARERDDLQAQLAAARQPGDVKYEWRDARPADVGKGYAIRVADVGRYLVDDDCERRNKPRVLKEYRGGDYPWYTEYKNDPNKNACWKLCRVYAPVTPAMIQSEGPWRKAIKGDELNLSIRAAQVRDKGGPWNNCQLLAVLDIEYGNIALVEGFGSPHGWYECQVRT